MTEFINANDNLTGVFDGSSVPGDFDGDGDLDLLVTGALGSSNEETISIESGTAKIYANNGANGFDEVFEQRLTGVYDSSVATDDFDGDGDLDLLITGDNIDGPTSEIYVNDGEGGFSEDTDANLTGVKFSSVSTGDFDGDDDVDLLITGRSENSPDSKISQIYTNDGEGGFSEDTDASLTGFDEGTADTEDFDGDGDLDLLLTGFDSSGNSTSKIYTNDGEGGFSEDTDANLAGVSFSAVTTGDFDGDEDIDLFLTGNGNRTGKVYTNDGSGSFSEDTEANPNGVGSIDGSAATGDYDNDGDLDLVITGLDNDEIAQVYINDGSGSFSEDTEADLTGVTFSSVVSDDLDGDSDLDLLITGLNNNGTATSDIYLNNAPLDTEDPDIENPDIEDPDTEDPDTEDPDSGFEVLAGTPDADVLEGSAGNSDIFARAGDDIVTGGDGDDRLYGQSDNDIMDGGAGDDTLLGGNGFDRLDGGEGDDLLYGRDSNTVYTGGDGSDVFILNDEGNVDWIRDYEVGVDEIGLTDGLTLGDVEITGNSNTIMSVDGDRIGVLLGVQPEDFDTDLVFEVDL